jgi:D-alanine-D-alanine ligase
MASFEEPPASPAAASPEKNHKPKPAAVAVPPGNPLRTLGPVSDLERHLPPDWWRTLFNSVYLKTDGDVVENDLNTRKEIDFLIECAGLDKNDRILDLCCGQARHTLELARRGFNHVTGLDRSRYLIRLARRRARAEGLTVALHEGDARKFRLPSDSFNCVCVMGNSFGYFDHEEDDAQVLSSILRVMKSGAVLAMDLVDGEWMKANFDPRSWEWIDQNHFVCRERSIGRKGKRLISREVVVHAEQGVIADQFYAERLYTRPEIQELLERVGFTNIRFHGNLQAESTRSQDLGFMANRFFLTARAPVKTRKAVKKGFPFPELTVLMGDPTLPDTVKKGGQFNEEDFDTIDRLKRALEEIPGIKTKFMNNHGNLLREIRQNPPAFVFNLCDEGYNNDAFMELHVPAILEMHGVPYTGAGPACLGLCYDKSIVRAIASSLDIPVPLETYFDPSDQSANLPSVFPALVKPNHGDSSIGITKDAVVEKPEDLILYLDRLRETLPGRPILIQEFLSGSEYSVGVIGNPGLTTNVLPLLEVDYSQLPQDLPRILGYESKWHPDSPYWTQIRYIEADLDEESRRHLIDYSMILFERLGCRDYARFDFRCDAYGEIKLLEVNPNPGWCWDGKLNLMASFAGYRYSDLLRMIIEAGVERTVVARG